LYCLIATLELVTYFEITNLAYSFSV